MDRFVFHARPHKAEGKRIGSPLEPLQAPLVKEKQILPERKDPHDCAERLIDEIDRARFLRARAAEAPVGIGERPIQLSVRTRKKDSVFVHRHAVSARLFQITAQRRVFVVIERIFRENVQDPNARRQHVVFRFHDIGKEPLTVLH